jgi:hypothetical protein
MGMLTEFRSLIARIWHAIHEIRELLHPCRFSIFVVIAGAALLLVNAQGREIAVGLVDAPVLWQGVLFQVCVFLWAFESWYWARMMLEMVHGSDRTKALDGRLYKAHEAWVIKHGPRLIAATAYVIAGAALLIAGAWGHAIAVVIIGIVFYWLLVKRTEWVNNWLNLAYNKAEEGKGLKRRKLLRKQKDNMSSLHDLPLLSKVILGLSMVLSLLVTLWIFIDAVSIGWRLGAGAVAFLGFALIVPVGSVIVYWARFGGTKGKVLGARGYPALTLLLLWAVLIGSLTDNHQVRRNGPVPTDRETLAAAALKWHDQAVKASGSNEPPLVIVATAGGGIRAAYWTATVLGRLQDEAPKFRNYLFGISGVSGGSLGASVFVTLLADGTEGLNIASCTGGDVKRKPFECAGQNILDRDFLAPTVAALLFPDLIQRFLPFPGFPDRAQALEQGWERAWKAAGFKPDTWTSRRFSQLWPHGKDAPYLPALFLNGTHVESGKRIITSNLKIDGSAFRDAYDFYDLSSGDLLPSTAALNSARFTYVSPAGTLEHGEKAVGHVVDGGYFENFGATTAREMLAAVMAALKAKGKKVRPVLIQISNDPKLGKDDLDVERVASPHFRKSKKWASELLSPLRALLNTRDARGVLAYKQFLRATNDSNRRAHFRLCSIEGQVDPALGWLLAPRSTKFMQKMIRTDDCGNSSEFAKVLTAIQ